MELWCLTTGPVAVSRFQGICHPWRALELLGPWAESQKFCQAGLEKIFQGPEPYQIRLKLKPEQLNFTVAPVLWGPRQLPGLLPLNADPLNACISVATNDI